MKKLMDLEVIQHITVKEGLNEDKADIIPST